MKSSLAELAKLASVVVMASCFTTHSVAKEEKLTLRLGFRSLARQRAGRRRQGRWHAWRAKKSKGRIQIELFPDQQLGSTGPQMIEMVKKGELDVFQGGAGMFVHGGAAQCVRHPLPFRFGRPGLQGARQQVREGNALGDAEPHGLEGAFVLGKTVSSLDDQQRSSDHQARRSGGTQDARDAGQSGARDAVEAPRARSPHRCLSAKSTASSRVESSTDRNTRSPRSTRQVL